MDTNRTPVAFVAERSSKGTHWCITPVYSDDWHSEMSHLFYRQGRIFAMSVTCSIHCGSADAHVEEGHHHVDSILVIDGEPHSSIGKLTRVAFSTEELARSWVSANGQPKVGCPFCHQPHAVRHPKSIYDGWLDIEEGMLEESDGRTLLISEHANEGVRCDGSATVITSDISTPQ